MRRSAFIAATCIRRHYPTVAAKNGHLFWQERAAANAQAALPPRSAPVDAVAMAALPVTLCRDAALVRTPSFDGEFVAVAEALHHPRLERPVVYLGGWELAPLLRNLLAGRTPLQIALSWYNLMPLGSGLAIASWIVSHGVLFRPQSRAGATPW
jgi:hypothetical protein